MSYHDHILGKLWGESWIMDFQPCIALFRKPVHNCPAFQKSKLCKYALKKELKLMCVFLCKFGFWWPPFSKWSPFWIFHLQIMVLIIFYECNNCLGCCLCAVIICCVIICAKHQYLQILIICSHKCSQNLEMPKSFWVFTYSYIYEAFQLIPNVSDVFVCFEQAPIFQTLSAVLWRIGMVLTAIKPYFSSWDLLPTLLHQSGKLYKDKPF